jgi:hypothetical protein
MQTIIKHTSGFITRLRNGDLTNSDQVTIILVWMAVLVLFVALFGNAYQGYYYN